MTPEIEIAVEQIRQTFAGCELATREDGEGGAFIIVEGVSPGSAFQQETTWVGFRLTFQYPFSDVYPVFVRGDLSRTDGRSIASPGIQTGYTFEGRPAVQLSRRSNHLNPATDTAALKVLKVLKWLGEQP